MASNTVQTVQPVRDKQRESKCQGPVNAVLVRRRVPTPFPFQLPNHPTSNNNSNFQRIEGWPVELRVHYFAEGISSNPEYLKNPKYFAAVRLDTERAKLPGCNRLPKRRVHDDMVYWPLVLLPEIEEGDKLHTELCEQTVVCLKMEFAFGLVLRKNSDDCERIGDINTFWGYCGEEKKVKKGQLGEGKRDLFELLPVERRTMDII
ncbi:hypothetical protein QBC38DRAFT_492283 [Podospora fimiseda]|uniref:Uncharacterized protein n=1 Tax=Podospora fimiseda TaxID=252190 RepID=A0AAN7BD27_9PEZI|nr:hypothetical protein QBC38DRAFT_492283 [Podospora fimiseda]